MKRVYLCVFVVLLARCGSAQAVQVIMTSTDNLGQTSFNTGLHWSDGLPPSSANTYVVPPGYSLRTPEASGNYIFSGSSLTVNGLSSGVGGAGGGALEFMGATGDVITVNDLILDYGYITGVRSFTIAGNITLANGGGFFDSAGNVGTVVTAPISGNSDAYIVNPQTLVRFSAANSYQGKTFIHDGSALQLDNTNAVQNSTVSVDTGNKLAFGGGLGTFNLGGLMGNAPIALIDTASSAISARIGGNGQSTTYSGTLSGNGSLTKVGVGTFTLTAANTYGGGTTVSAGTLLANNTNGSATGTGNVTVANGATLAGSGSVSGGVNVEGTLSPGNSIETLAIGAVSFGSTSTFQYEIDSTSVSADLLSVPNGNLTIATGAALALSDLNPGSINVGTKFTMVNYNGTWNGGTFAGLPDLSFVTIGTNTFQIRYQDLLPGGNFLSEATGSRFVTLTAVPEPSSFFMMGLLGCWLLGTIRFGRLMA